MIATFSFKRLTQIAIAIIFIGNASVYAADADVKLKVKIDKECSADPATSDNCIVRNFKDSPQASMIRGKIAFAHYCVLCHGVSGQGDGRAAKIHTPKPANLKLSTYPPEYLSMIIRKGGTAMGRSPAMPPWEEQLTDEQVRDVVSHLMFIRKPVQ